MGLRTAQQYLQGLRDGRYVTFKGERVEDVTTHEHLGVGARHTALDFELAEAPEHRELFTWTDDSGALHSRYFKRPEDAQDLLNRREMIETSTREAASVVLLVKEIGSEVSSLTKNADVVTALRRYKDRETLRIAYGDIVRQQHVNTVTRQISFLADAICEAATQVARGKLEQKRGVPRNADGDPAEFVILALGKLGGSELNYSSDIDLIFLYDGEGKTNGERALSNWSSKWFLPPMLLIEIRDAEGKNHLEL